MNCDCDCHKLDTLTKLKKCEDRHKVKDRRIKELKKKVQIGTLVGVAIAAIFGKETLDTIVEWLSSIQSFGSASSDVFSVYPSPGVLSVFAAAFLLTGVKRRK
jgi:hypothetical protein